MADSLVSIALDKLTNALHQRFTLFAGATPELEKLETTLESIQAVLDDAESRQVGEKSVKLWLSRLRHITYDVEDLLEDGLKNDDGDSRNEVCECLPSPYKSLIYVVSRYKVARRIKEIRERLDHVADEKNKYNFSSGLGGDRMLVRSRSQTTSLVDESEVIVGREDEKEMMVTRLVSETCNEDGGRVHVVCLVGLGGLGKTTLARQIYHDSRVQNHFKDGLYWVCVSEVFDVVRITKAIQEQIEEIHNFPSELDALQKKLCKALRWKRFLLILDDVWNDDADKWKKLRLPLLSGAPGSRILITTRSRNVVDTMNAAYIHDLKCLSNEQSWALFSSRAFAGRKADERSQFEVVGKEIAKNCKGVPLSLKVIGSAMNSKNTVEDWQKVLDSKAWLRLSQVSDKILPALFITYVNLPPHLKQCFAYCSMFPKDWEFEKDMLVGLWVAQGFIRSERKEEMEDIGAEYFDDLVLWSIFQQVETVDGETRYIMHDLLHALAESITKDEIYTRIHNDGGRVQQCPGSNVRHAFLSCIGTDSRPCDVPVSFDGAKRLRTLFLSDVCITDSVIVDLFRDARFLRALLFIGSEARWYGNDAVTVKLPEDAIGKMKHLRYLNLSRLNIVELPESVTYLCNLHTLQLDFCTNLKKLPRGIGRMVGLRHFELKGTESLEYLPKGLGRISCLRSLSKFIVGGGRGGGCGIDELRQLNCLQGSLTIEHLERISSRGEAEKAELLNKRLLRSLVLSMSEDDIGEMRESAVDGLRPPENLEQLELIWGSSSKFPCWMEEGGSFPYLNRLEIQGTFRGEQCNLRGLGKFPALTSLSLNGVGMKTLGHAFPKLEEFLLLDMHELENWELPTASESAGDDHVTSESDDHDMGKAKVVIMQCLRKLEVRYCPKLKRLPSALGQLEKLSSLQISDLDALTCFPDSLCELESLEVLRVSYCRVLKSLPHSLGQLKKLKSLEIIDLGTLTYFPDSLGELESLELLRISNCRALQSLPHSLGRLKKLNSLEIIYLGALTCFPDSLGELESLELLQISYCQALKSLPYSLGQLKKLHSLEIVDLGALACFPDSLGDLESLELLRIIYCPVLESLPHSLGQLKKLNSLEIVNLGALTCFPNALGELESLEHLRIIYCRALESLPYSLGQLKKLNSLEIIDLGALKCLPDSLGELESLELLRISYCRALESLPHSLGQLKKLNSLEIVDLSMLTCFPNSLGELESLELLRISYSRALESLPHSLEELKALKHLIILNCGALGLRCKSDGGEDWPKISHILRIDIFED